MSFVLDWRPGGSDSEPPSDAKTNAAPTGAAPAEAAGGGGGGGGRAEKAGARATDDSCGHDDGDDAAVAARRAARAREEERELEEKGREALMRLGIFLEKHEVQEDTVDVLSSAGWI